MRLVLDSNVIIAAFAARGLCEVLFEYSISNHEVYISEAILKEIKEKFRTKIKVPENLVSEIDEYLRKSAEIVKPAAIDLPELKDKSDLPVMGTAASASAEYLITGDKELQRLRTFRKTSIVSPRSFWEEMKDG